MNLVICNSTKEKFLWEPTKYISNFARIVETQLKYKWQKNQNRIAAIDPKRALWFNSWPFLTFLSVAEKTVGSYFGSWGHALVAVAFVERFK